MLETVAEDEEDARFESTTVTVAPPPTYKAPPPLSREPRPVVATFLSKLHVTRDIEDEITKIPPPPRPLAPPKPLPLKVFDVNVQDNRVTVDDEMYIPPPLPPLFAVFDVNVQDDRGVTPLLSCK